MELREASRSDAPAIATLHADSWRFAYRGAYNDQYLDAEADGDRLVFWQDRLDKPAPNQRVIVLVDDASLIGFACVFTNHHPEFGSFLNNLHIAKDFLRRGHGTRLMAEIRDRCEAEAPLSPLYLLVLASNLRAQAFYARLGGVFRQSYPWTPPGGGSLSLHQFVWPSPRHISL